MSNNDTTDELEVPLLSWSSRTSNLFHTIRTHPICQRLILLAILSVFALVLIAIHAYDNRQSVPLLVSSLNVSKDSSGRTWDTKLSLKNYPNGCFKGLDGTYEAQAWLYSRGGVLSMTSPLIQRSSDGKELVFRAFFNVEREDIEALGNVVVDLLIEVSSTLITYGMELRSFLMIDCINLKIEFLHQRLGTLSVTDAAKRCLLQICPTKSDVILGGADKCYTTSFAVL